MEKNKSCDVNFQVNKKHTTQAFKFRYAGYQRQENYRISIRARVKDEDNVTGHGECRVCPRVLPAQVDS